MEPIHKMPLSIGDLADEHLGIRGILAAIERERHMKALAAKLERLHGVLRAHFELEEGPEGLAHVIGGSAPNLMGKLERILAQHDGILAEVRGLMGLVHDKRAAAVESVRDEVAAMVARIRAHEMDETELLTSVTSEDTGVGD